MAPRETFTGKSKKTAQDIENLDLITGMGVNPSQLEAVKLAMTKRLALIQGPPG